MARAHYENFPVASILLPARLRPHVAAVYAFARHADDIADEGDDGQAVRIERLDAWRALLRDCTSPGFETRTDIADPARAIFLALGDTIAAFDVPTQLFEDLLDAFRQDIVKETYDTFDEVLDYCRRSANPVGRILLALFGRLDEHSAAPSDALCTALQLANFWQDVSVDIAKPRVYIPAEDFARFGVDRGDFEKGLAGPEFRVLMRFEVERARSFFIDALPLFPVVPLRLRLELRAVWRGGMRILDKIGRVEYNTRSHRPTLSRIDALVVLAGLLRDPHI
ncbi:MAG: squalene synthase HpnC [Ignavibacteria bacterium]|nr:squalene synthase HpnC [Ignavibacteria bacterium]